MIHLKQYSQVQEHLLMTDESTVAWFTYQIVRLLIPFQMPVRPCVEICMGSAGAGCPQGILDLNEGICIPLPPWALRSGPRKTIYYQPSEVHDLC